MGHPSYQLTPDQIRKLAREASSTEPLEQRKAELATRRLAKLFPGHWAHTGGWWGCEHWLVKSKPPNWLEDLRLGPWKIPIKPDDLFFGYVWDGQRVDWGQIYDDRYFSFAASAVYLADIRYVHVVEALAPAEGDWNWWEGSPHSPVQVPQFVLCQRGERRPIGTVAAVRRNYLE